VRRKCQGSALEPARNLCLLYLPQRARPFAICPLGGRGGRANRDLATPVSALLPHPPKMSGSKGHCPWRGPGAAPLVGSGVKPRRCAMWPEPRRSAKERDHDHRYAHPCRYRDRKLMIPATWHGTALFAMCLSRRSARASPSDPPGELCSPGPLGKGGGPLQSVHWLGSGRGPTVTYQRLCRPSPTPQQNWMVPRATALGGVPRGSAPGQGPG